MHGKLKMENIKASLLNEESRSKEISFSNHSEANYEAQESNRERSKSQVTRGRDNSMDKSNSKSRVIYHYCDKSGHIKRFCKKIKRDIERKGDISQVKSDEKTTTSLAIIDDDLLFIGDKECLNVACDDYNRVIDSSASYHTKTTSLPTQECFIA